MGRLLISLLVFAAALARPAWPAPKNPADLTKPPTARPKSADPPRRGRSRRDTARRIARINRQLTALFEQKKYEQCEALLKEALKLDPDNGITWYNLACVHSRTGRKDRAVEALDTAVAHGYSGFRHMERDPDLDAIRKMPGYRKIIARRDEIHRERAEKIRDRLRKEFGEGYLVGVDHERKLVFATNVDRHTLDEMKQRLTTYATAQWADLFTHGFERYHTVVVPRSSDWPSERMGGFYARQTHTLYARNVGMTLVHEFTHALHAADQDGFGQHHPIWVTEGLATLFETSRVADGHAMPRVNRRLNLLQHLVRRKRTAPL